MTVHKIGSGGIAAAASQDSAGAVSRHPSARVTESAFYATVIDAARIAGWRAAHFRPARTSRGWRTPVQGDGAGFPDFVLVHPVGRVWFVELKRDKARLAPEQADWGQVLLQAGAVFRVVHVPSGIDTFCQDLIDSVRPA